MRYLKKFETIDHSDIDPFNEENWDDYSKLLEDNGYKMESTSSLRKMYVKESLDGRPDIHLTITNFHSGDLFDFHYFFSKMENKSINSIINLKIRTYSIDENILKNVEKEFTKMFKNSENV